MTQDNKQLFDLSELSDFQFGPSWARESEKKSTSEQYAGNYREPREPRRSSGKRPPRTDRPHHADRGERRERRPMDRDRGRGTERGKRPFTPRVFEPRPDPTPKLRVEMRPANGILEIISKEVQRNKRILPLIDLAKLVMHSAERCDLVLMKMEDGPELIQSKKGDGACWLTEQEAIAHFWKSDCFSEYYRQEKIEVEAPQGNFTAIAVCALGKEIIGPVNWHGYQAAVAKLYKGKYSNRMSMEEFRNKINVDKSEEILAKWQEEARYNSVWKPNRETAEDITLNDARAVEEDFLAHHYKDVYEVTDKVFINCATAHKLLSPGLAAHLRIQSDRARKFPQMLIANLCHGLARHHMPIFKWHGDHYTGASRIRVVPADMVLADRMKEIIDWAKNNSGRKVDCMFAELTGVSYGEDEESHNAANKAHAPYTADLIWLIEQGFIVVTNDNSIWDPKGSGKPSASATAETEPKKKKRSRSRKKKPAATTQEKSQETPIKEQKEVKETPATPQEEQTEEPTKEETPQNIEPTESTEEEKVSES